MRARLAAAVARRDAAKSQLDIALAQVHVRERKSSAPTSDRRRAVIARRQALALHHQHVQDLATNLDRRTRVSRLRNDDLHRLSADLAAWDHREKEQSDHICASLAMPLGLARRSLRVALPSLLTRVSQGMGLSWWGTDTGGGGGGGGVTTNKGVSMTVWRGARILHGHSLASVWPRGGSADATGEYDGRATTTVSRHGDDQRPHHDHQKEHHRHHHHDHHQHHQAPPPPPSEDAEITTAVVAALAQLAEEIARLTGSPRGPRLIFPAHTFDTSTSTASTISLRIQIAMPSTFWDYLLPSWQRVPPKSSAFVKGGRRGRNTGAGPLPPSMPSLSTTLGDETNFIIAQVAREVRTVAVSLADTYRFLHAGLVEDGKTNTGPVVLLDRATGFMGCPRGGPVWLLEQIQRLTDDTARCEIKRASSPPPGGGHDRSDHSRFADSSTTTLPSAYVSDSPPPYPPGLSSPVRPTLPHVVAKPMSGVRNRSPRNLVSTFSWGSMSAYHVRRPRHHPERHKQRNAEVAERVQGVPDLQGQLRPTGDEKELRNRTSVRGMRAQARALLDVMGGGAGRAWAGRRKAPPEEEKDCHPHGCEGGSSSSRGAPSDLTTQVGGAVIDLGRGLVAASRRWLRGEPGGEKGAMVDELVGSILPLRTGPNPNLIPTTIVEGTEEEGEGLGDEVDAGSEDYVLVDM